MSAANGTFTAASGTLQNVTEIWGGVTVDGNGNLLDSAAPIPLVKSGPGTLVVAGVNTYSAGTIITGGTLAIGAAPTAAPLQPLVHYTFNDGTIGQYATTFQDTGTANLPISGIGGQWHSDRCRRQVHPGGPWHRQPAVTAAATALEGYSAYTVSYWMNTDGYSGGGIFTTRLSTGGVDQYYNPGNNSGQLISEIYTTGSSWVSPELDNLNLSGWNLITTTVGGGVWSVFIDGTLASGGSGTYSGDAVLSQGENLYLLTAPAAGFQGELGDFRIYGSVLSQSQINSLYAGGEATITGTGNVGALPATTAVQIAAGSALDLSGLNQTIGSLSDYTIGSGGTVTNSGGTLATLTVAPSGGSSTTFSGVIQDGNAQTALTINGNGTQDLAGANTFSGPTTLTAGTLQLDNAYAVQNSTVSVGTASSLTFGTGVGTVYLGGLAGAGNVTLDDLGNNAVTIQVGGNNASTTYSGVLSGDGGLTKNGTGMLTLGGANTYTGSTVISAGTLQLGAGATLTPVVRYSFAGGTVGLPAAATYTDLSGNGNTLTIRDGGVQYAAGKFGTALAFNGQYTYSADIPSGSVLTTMTSWTSSIWINIPSANIGNQQSMVMARYSGGVSANDGNGFEMGYDPGGGGVWVAVLNTGNSWAWYGDMPATISPDTWTMVTTTVTAAGINLYIDGVQVGATQGLTQSGGTPMFTQAGNDILDRLHQKPGWVQRLAGRVRPLQLSAERGPDHSVVYQPAFDGGEPAVDDPAADRRGARPSI